MGKPVALDALNSNILDIAQMQERAGSPAKDQLTLLPAYTPEEIEHRLQLADQIADAVSAATSAQAVKGATPASVRHAAMTALGVSPQVSGPQPIESGDAAADPATS